MPFIGTQPEVGGYSVLDALTASATASYTLQLNSANFVPSSANQLLVSLNGVIQKPGSSFTVSGSTLTFSSALTSSDSIDFILAMGEPLLVGTPSDNTVTTNKLVNDSVTGAKIENNPTIAGNLTTGGTLTSTGLVTASAGVAIGGTGAANTLDDYEEGTWTPFYTTANNNLTLNGNASTTSSMYTTQGGSYIKIGRKVICHMSIATNGVTSHAGSGNLWIGGLPFTMVATSSTEPRGVNGAMAGRFNNFTPDQLVINSNATTIQIRAGFESYPTRSNLDTGGSGNRNVIEALIVYSVA